MTTRGGLSDRAAMLGQVPLFAGLDRSHLEELATRAAERTYSRGVAIVRQGEEGLGFYLVLNGTADVLRSGQPLATLLPGQFFGETALLEAQPRTADVRATSEVDCLILDRQSFWEVLGVDPDTDRRKFEAIVDRLRSPHASLTE